MTRVVLSIGSNLGGREAHIEAMERGLRLILVDVRVSELMETEPVGVDGPQPSYLNRIVAGYYSGGARQLLEACHTIEARLGRTREKSKGARTADVDILLFGGHEICEDTPPKTLVIPHPQILNRRFCLEGLAQVGSHIVVPGLGGGRTAGELLKNISAEAAAQNVSFVGRGHEKMDSEFKLPPHINYLCIEGVIGVGKTSLCNILGERLNARLALEEVDGNPFLAKFYANRRLYAFQTQLWFLLSRYRQLTGAAVEQRDLFHSLTIGDYIFDKDRIFASMNLQGEEMELYDSIAGALEKSVPKPDLVVYLQASTETLVRRIEKRARAFENDIDIEYIDELNQAYNSFFFHYTDSPLLIIDTNEVDFVEEVRDLDELAEQIVSARPGTNFYKPLGARNINSYVTDSIV